ncbi:alpha/beta fold hydrolase [Phaeovulum vinaykumarii]|uniref:Lysophospholipase n=2 Tax=Phaeovulum vinaykumarii TaxID=407234 RepID=A0A1N7MGX6_9RHOB|nr:alpha/beta hydrolase [Phaeovulum vinaykumarii]SIS85396.1 lysophospholipase [Phaeovulum vinaykumarii]SOC12228.1 lysophospholipase [Phaeovulum vinaykumarii]
MRSRAPERGAPFHAAMSMGPPGAEGWWLWAADGVRLRAVHWHKAAAKGTVILFTGRTEYCEKYGPAAAALAHEGYGTVTLDWRGQGLSDRLLDDPLRGHIEDFADYQRDVAALMAAAEAMHLKPPFFLLAHSMGGTIGLRALHRGVLPVRAAAFSAPMWGIKLPLGLGKVAPVLAANLLRMGLGGAYAPMTGPVTYVLRAPFHDNMLTRDPAMWAFLIRHLAEEPGINIAGPTLAWVDAGLRECAQLMEKAAPDLPALASLGTHERIVEPGPIRDLMARWPKGRLIETEGVEHEIMMDRPETRARFFEAVTGLFDAHLN